jgi:hypothetical protein
MAFQLVFSRFSGRLYSKDVSPVYLKAHQRIICAHGEYSQRTTFGTLNSWNQPYNNNTKLILVKHLSSRKLSSKRLEKPLPSETELPEIYPEGHPLHKEFQNPQELLEKIRAFPGLDFTGSIEKKREQKKDKISEQERKEKKKAIEKIKKSKTLLDVEALNQAKLNKDSSSTQALEPNRTDLSGTKSEQKEFKSFTELGIGEKLTAKLNELRITSPSYIQVSLYYRKPRPN